MASAPYLELEKLWRSTVVSRCTLLSYASDLIYARAELDRLAYGIIPHTLKLLIAGTMLDEIEVGLGDIFSLMSSSSPPNSDSAGLI
jgi:hypothetical protein